MIALSRIAVAATVLLAGVAYAADPSAMPSPATAPTTAPSVDTVTVDARTEEVIKAALRYLAAKQTPNGSWTSPNGEHPVAVTGYTVIAMLATGNLPNEGEYGKNVSNGVAFLLSCVRHDGYITSEGASAGKKGSNMYDHGIGTIALAEVYGQTQDPKVREKLVLAIKLIIKAQNGAGGWRYQPRPADADMSVTVLQVVALRAARNAGLDVPQKVIDDAVKYVKSCQDAKSGGFCYQPHQGPGFARTAAAIYSLQVCGLYDDPMVKTGADYLIRSKVTTGGEWFTYGSFYSAPAFYMIGGEQWKTWYEKLKTPLLAQVIVPAGDSSIAYWNVLDNNARAVGPVYATAVYTTILAMPYHYIPLYQR